MRMRACMRACACVRVGSWVALGGCLWVGGVSGSGGGCQAVWVALVGSGGGSGSGGVWSRSLVALGQGLVVWCCLGLWVWSLDGVKVDSFGRVWDRVKAGSLRSPCMHLKS